MAVQGPAAPRRRGLTRFLGERISFLGIAPFTIYVLIFMGLPLYEVFHGAFTDATTGAFTWSNISTTLSQSQFHEGFKNSLILSAWTALAGAIFGTWLAAAVLASKAGGMLQRVVSSGSGVLAYFAGVPLAFAFIATLGRSPGGVFTGILKDVGIDLYAHGFNISSMFGVGLVYVYFQVPLMVILITPALEGLRPQWREAAESLGASRLSYLRHIAIPVLAPGFIGATLVLFGNAFSAYATALALVGSTIPLVPAQINAAINGNVLVNESHLALALGVDMIVVILVVMIGYWLVQSRARKWLQ